jgi:hypothetical protein
LENLRILTRLSAQENLVVFCNYESLQTCTVLVILQVRRRSGIV